MNTLKAIGYAAFIALAPSWIAVPHALADQASTDAELCEYAPEWAIDASIVCRPEEDSPEWDCTTMGNQVCGPGNPQGVAPGRYENG